jgi:hypothetical protein
MAEQSHRDEMNAAIRAQRERQAAPRTIAPPEEAPAPTLAPTPTPAVAPEPEPPAEGPPPRKSLLDRLRGR